MAQNLRTMQDDLREAREKSKKPAFGFMQKKETKEDLNKNTDLPTETPLPPNEIEKEEKPIVTEKKQSEMPETEVIKIEKTENLISRLQEDEDKEEEEKTIKNEAPTQIDNKPGNFESVLKDIEETSKTTTPNNQDKELQSLTERISKSMDSTDNNKTEEVRSKLPEKQDKDQELKDLIQRMSQNIQETNEELQDLTEKLSESESQLKELQSKEIQVETDNKIEEAITEPEETADAKIEQTPELYPLEEQVIVEESPAEDKEVGEKQTDSEEDNKKGVSYWERLHKAVKSKQEGVTIVTPEVIKEEEAKAQEGGIITPKKLEEEGIIEEETKENDSLPDTKTPNFYNNYISPENRLVFGKQEYYSSIHKKIKPKTKKENLEKFKDTLKSAEQLNILTAEEEKKMLKKQIAKKYHINLDALPWKKIILASVIFLAIWGVSIFYIFKNTSKPDNNPIVQIEGKSIEKIDQRIEKEVSASINKVSGINYFDTTTDPWKDFPEESIIRLRITNNENENILSKEDALKTILGNDNYEKIPKNFIESTAEGYNIIVFKNNNSIRLGIAIQFETDKNEIVKQSLSEWETTNNKQQRIQSVMKNLFVSSRTNESESNFSSAIYKNTELKYLNLPDTGTSMDYFIHENIVVFATSKDNTLAMIDTLTQ